MEIDPAVYEAATRYFGLVVPEPEKVFLTDARGWVISQTHAGMQGVSDITQDTPSFDIVIHDCFSGGGVPSHLFTQPFWEDLRKLVKPDGVVAVVSSNKYECIRPSLTAGNILRRTLPENWLPTHPARLF